VSKPAANDDASWVEGNVRRYREVHDQYEAFAQTLAKVLQKAARKLAPLAIVQARAKAIPSFAEKIVRKRHLYQDPLVDVTDLCGGRVITHTAEQVRAFCEFIRDHFIVDEGDDVSQRLRPTEFGYRSVHFIVLFKPGVFPNQDVDVSIPEELYDLKGEIQVRTILEHAWADIGHDLTYKTEMRVPEKFHREFAALAAVLESADREFGRIHESLRSYSANYGAYLEPEQVRAEIGKLELVLQHDRDNVELATKIANLAMTVGDWQKAIDVLTPYESAGHQPALRHLGIALYKISRHRKNKRKLLEGRKLLKTATATPHRDPEGLLALAETWRTEDEDQARKLYRRAFELDPTNPTCLSNYVEYEIACQRTVANVSLVAPSIRAAIQRCRNQIEAEVNLPLAYQHLGTFHLLLGEPYDSLAAFARSIQLCPASYILEAALQTIDRLRVIADKLEGYGWVHKLLLLGLATRYRLPDACKKIRQWATADAPRIRKPVVIVAGGCDESVEKRMQRYRQLLEEAFVEFQGTILSGGTTQGISGLVGELRRHAGKRLRTIGYIPRLVPPDATMDERYDQIRRTDGSGFTPLEPLQNWIDVFAAGIPPAEVKLLGINGGIIAATEYRIAAALGAQVVLLEGSGRAAATTLADPDWQGLPNLVGMPRDPMTIRAYVGPGVCRLPEADCRTIAKGFHETYRRTKSLERSAEPSMADWDQLPPPLQKSNLEEARHIFEKLREIGCTIAPLEGPEEPVLEFTPEEVERLAEMEHGRFNAERLLAGWQYGPTRDVEKKISPYLVSWEKLQEHVKELDRSAVRQIPALLAAVGRKIVRESEAESR
jgi:ppGpp synthetase/RelA/SpoT-type nucleotidyltranferase